MGLKKIEYTITSNKLSVRGHMPTKIQVGRNRNKPLAYLFKGFERLMGII